MCMPACEYVCGACVPACVRVYIYNRTIIYSAIWSSIVERETGICFNYLLPVGVSL